MGGWNLLGGLMPPAVDTAGESERRHSRDLGVEEEFEVLNNENQDVSYAKDLSLENAILANFPDGCDRSFIVESKDEDSYDIIPKNLTFAEVISILNQAVKEDNYEKLDEVIQNIEDYEGRSITLESTNLKNFCEQQLNLDLRNNQHIYSNILSQYKFNQVELKYDYLVKELVLLAIAANDKLAEKYQDILFAEGNLSLLPLLVGGQEYIKAFIEKFHSIDEVYNKIKDQTIQLVEPNKIGFFSTIALRKEQELLGTVLAEPFLRDLEHVLKTSNPDPLYGVLETASLVKNEKFITIALNAFERYVDEPTKDLLKGSFVTLLETAISQEHLPIIEYLCKRYINNKGSTSYEQAFVDDRIIKVLNQQILKNIGARDRKKIYDLVLKTALDAGNIEFIEHLFEEYAECSNDIIDYLNQKLKNNEFDNVYESALIALSNIENKDIVIDVIAHVQTYQSISHNEQVTRQVIKNLLRNAVRYSTDQEDYSLIKKVCYLCTESDEISVIFREECEIFKSSIEKRMEDLERKNKLLQSEALHEYNYNYVPGVVNGLAQVAHAGYDIYTEDPKYNKRQKNTDLILNLMHIRNILQFSIDVQEYSCTERQDLWNQMYSTPATFIVRKKSDNTADKSAIPAITSDILSENSESQSTDSKQLQRSIVDKGENIMNNKKVSIEETIDNNNYRRVKMNSSDQNIKTVGEMLSDAIFALNYEEVISLVEQAKQEGNSVDTKQILNKALEDANKKEVGKKDKVSKSKLAEIKIFLEKELEKTTAVLPVNDSVESMGATVISQEIPVVEREGSESSLSSEDDDFSKLESDDSPRISSDSPSFDIISETEVPETAAEMPSMVTEGKSDNLNDEKDDQQNFTIPTTADQGTSPIPGSQFGTAHNEEDFTVQSQSSSLGFANESLNTVILTSDSREEQVFNQPAGHIEQMANGDTQPELEIVATSALPKTTANGTVSSNSVPCTFRVELTSDDEDEFLSIKIEDVNNDINVNQPTEHVEQVANGNGQPKTELPRINEQSSKSGLKKNSQNTKKYVVAASALAITGIALGVAVAVYLEMLAIGVAVAACCLIAATITYCYRPKSLVEDNEVEKVQKSTSYCG
ncbi:MAG: hypothetical protein AB3P07_03390 [Wolbachia pipientis]